MRDTDYITTSLNELDYPSIIEYSYLKNKYLKLSVMKGKT